VPQQGLNASRVEAALSWVFAPRQIRANASKTTLEAGINTIYFIANNGADIPQSANLSIFLSIDGFKTAFDAKTGAFRVLRSGTSRPLAVNLAPDRPMVIGQPIS
jgi:hypothetical protein